MNTHSLPVRIAKASLSYLMEHGRTLPEFGEALPEDLQKPAGVFVSLKKQGQLRGCIGTILPTQANAATEIIRNAVSAATADPRFPRVQPAELEQLVVSVDILGEPERIDSMSELDPRRYGVIVRRGSRSGVLLPDLEGVNTVEEQIAIACNKAGIKPDEPIEMYRFEVVRYH